MIIILPAKPEDAGEIQELLYKTWLATYPNAEHGITTDDIKALYKTKNDGERIAKREEALRNPRSGEFCFVAKDDSRVVGFCRTVESVSGNKLQAIYVIPDFQGKGVGKALWNEASKKFNPSKDIFVEVATYNLKAIVFYKSLGFKETGKTFTEERFRMKSGSIIPETELVIRRLDGRVDQSDLTWKRYAEKTSGAKPRRLLVEALRYVTHKGEALDMGAGALNESKLLLSEGFAHVTAIDAEESVAQAALEIKNGSFSFVRSTFIDFKFTKATYDIVNAQYALPFNGKREFNALIQNIYESLKIGGIFTGQFFGDKDSWNTAGSSRIFHTADEARAVLSLFELIKFEEEENDAPTALGNPKHWHVFHFIVRKAP